MTNLKVALCQSSPWTGDFNRNFAKIKEHYDSASSQGADIALFGEGALQGYWSGDLYNKDSYIQDIRKALGDLINYTAGKNTAIVIGVACHKEDGNLFNSVAGIENGRFLGFRHKQILANDGACMDSRWFTPAQAQEPIEIKGIKIGIPICEDIWSDGVCQDLRNKGAEILLVANASPFSYGRIDERIAMAKKRVAETGIPLVYVNDTGGYDSVLMDGQSFALNAQGDLIHQSPIFKTDVSVIDMNDALPIAYTENDFYSTVWNACTFGLQQYVTKNNFKGVVLGLSGGVDSAITCAMAVDALGADNVCTVMMPSPYTSQESLNDAKGCVDALGVQYDIVNIGDAMTAFEGIFSPLMAGTEKDSTEENIQARIRGNIIMALSNKFGYLALTTGNKSENAVGYATLYGDMCGGLNLIKDIYKTDIFNLCTWRNTQSDIDVIPTNIISKPPTAELRENQKDADSLPPYDKLDNILKGMLEQDLDINGIIEKYKYDRDTVKRIWWLTHLAEYKRQQSAIGLKLTSCDFENDRKYPVCNGYTAYNSNR